jgi:hypothetical protein
MASLVKKHYWYVIVPAVSLVAFLIAGAIWVRSSETIDPKTGCGEEISRKTVILIDHSQAISQQTQDEIVHRILNFVHNRVQDGELVSIFTLDDLSRQNFTPLFSHCKPRSKGNELKEDVEAIREEFMSTFEQPLREILSHPVGEAHQTVLAEALINLSLSGYLVVGDCSGKKAAGMFKSSPPACSANLIIFSDMMEHELDSNNQVVFSLYGSTSRDEVIRLFCSQRPAAEQRPHFRNVKIYLHIIPRYEARITSDTVRCRDGFWQWFFGDNKCSCTEEQKGVPCDCMFIDSRCDKNDSDENCYCLCVFNLPG